MQHWTLGSDKVREYDPLPNENLGKAEKIGPGPIIILGKDTNCISGDLSFIAYVKGVVWEF